MCEGGGYNTYDVPTAVEKVRWWWKGEGRTDSLVDGGGRSQVRVLQHSSHGEGVLHAGPDAVVADGRVQVVRALFLVTLSGHTGAERRQRWERHKVGGFVLV